jgi:NAD/NADP transhydrogenase beta subunit
MINFAGNQQIIELIYLVTSALFILSLKWMSSPTTAQRGVRAGEIGMVLAIGGTLLHHGIVDYKWIAIALVLGTVIGIPLGLVHMTAVPQRYENSTMRSPSAEWTYALPFTRWLVACPGT